MHNRRKTLGGRLNQTREFSDVTPDQMARALGVSRRTINNWESDRTTPNVHQLILWADVTGWPVVWYFEDLEPKRPPLRAVDETVTRGSDGQPPPQRDCGTARLPRRPAAHRAAQPRRCQWGDRPIDVAGVDYVSAVFDVLIGGSGTT